MNSYPPRFSVFGKYVGASGALAVAVAAITVSPSCGEEDGIKLATGAGEQVGGSLGATTAVSAPASEETRPPQATVPSQAAVRAAMAKVVGHIECDAGDGRKNRRHSRGNWQLRLIKLTKGL